MDDADALAAYHAFETRRLPGGGEAVVKPGVRGYPDLAPGAQLLLSAAPFGGGRVADLSGAAGVPALEALRLGAIPTVLEPSCAALRCAARTLAGHPDAAPRAGLPWDAPERGADAALLVPPTDRGSRRVEAELRAAHRALRDGGALYAAMPKGGGAKRYEKVAAALFGDLRVLDRSRGWRLVEARRRGVAGGPVDDGAGPWTRFEVEGRPFAALAGTFAAGRLDAGSALLLGTLDAGALRGLRVLDLGCGTGVLALAAARAGAAVVAVDDDLAAVRSTERSAALQGLEVRVVHSDVDSALDEGARFDAVLANPPFHVGKRVRLELPGAFVAAAHARLAPGGAMTLVANRALPYERLFSRWRSLETLAQEGAFKVLRGVR